MGRKVTVDNLSEAINKILEEYGEEVNQNLEQITTQVAKTGVQALRSASSIFGSGKYKSGWTVDFERWRGGYIKAHIWNSKVPGLPHLLENGHLLRNGRRSPGRVHIQPVEQRLIEEFTRQIEAKL